MGTPKWLSGFFRGYDHSFFLRLVVGIITLGPPALLACARYIPFLDNLMKSEPVIPIACVSPALIAIPVKILKDRAVADDPKIQRDLLTLFTAIDRVVNLKLKRFTDCHKNNHNPPSTDAARVLLDAEQPDSQIEEMVESMWIVFDQICDSADPTLRVALAEMGEKHIRKFLHFFPSFPGPKSTEAELQADDAGFTQCKRIGRMIVLENLPKEAKKRSGRKFRPTRPDFEQDEGSMILYPIRHPSGGTPYVISICSKKPKQFKRSNEDHYERILSRFASRIALEHTVKMVKEQMQNERRN